jgi:hypothetical protein
MWPGLISTSSPNFNIPSVIGPPTRPPSNLSTGTPGLFTSKDLLIKNIKNRFYTFHFIIVLINLILIKYNIINLIIINLGGTVKFLLGIGKYSQILYKSASILYFN